jgi:diguanylate cyclase
MAHGLFLLLAAKLAVLALAGLGALLLAGWRRLRADLAAAHADARTDAITGLPNRRALDEALAELPTGHALLFIDIDGFKAVNDGHGHAAGDVLLARLAAYWPRDGYIARYGGDEFVALVDGAIAFDFAARLRAAGAAGTGATVSIGLAFGDPATLLARADAALAAAKARGGNRLVADGAPARAVPRAA